jgi:hypothetical protein
MPHRTPNTNPRGPKVRDIPDGYEQIAQVSIQWLEAKRAFEKVDTRLRDLIGSSKQHAPNCSTTPDEANEPALEPQAELAGGNATKLAFILVEHPLLDYQAAADRIWGPGLPFQKAKNRISTLLWTLRKLGVVTTKGGKVHQIDRARLAAISGLPVSGPKEPTS